MTTLLPDVQKFLSESPIPHQIHGEPHPSADGSFRDVINPSDGTVLTRTAFGGEKEIYSAVEAASRAFPSWSALSVTERAAHLHRWADLMEKEAATLAQLESLDVGKAVTAAEGFDIPFGIEGVRYFADLSTHAQYDLPLAIKNIEARVHRTPFGVCGFIFPWNFPFDLLIWGVAPALAAGNTVVVKPSEVTPLSTLFAAQLAARAGLPPGVLNVVVGDGPHAGHALTTHPSVRRMSFTGSPEAGSIVAAACGKRIIPCKLELGGKGAAVVFEDADVPDAAAKLAAAITLNTGQVCCTATRWLVHENVADSFKSAAVEALKRVRIGPGIDRNTMMGPVVSSVQLERIRSYYQKGTSEGARVILAPEQSREPGFYISPWLLEGDPGNVCYREEIFGPAAYITTFDTDREALDLIHAVDYGLANSLWTQDFSRAARFARDVQVGNTWINAHNVFAYGLPYGGINRSGMGGGVNSPATFSDYLRDHTIARPL